tara:strand:+ start:413 stop:1312 length:900 start_codon:yes stop_codon:yes gene_type:complete
MSYLFQAFKTISKTLRTSSEFFKHNPTTGLHVNASGDKIKLIDLYAHNVIVDTIKNNNKIIGYISEEQDDIQFFNGKKDGIIVSFDPIDGSKNIETNTGVGTIYCFLQYSAKEDKITKVIEAGYCLYGFTTIVLRANDEGVTLYKLNSDDYFDKGKKVTSLGKEKIYAVNESHSDTINKEYKLLLSQYKSNKYNQRWIGCMVADCHQIITLGGVFMYLTSNKRPNGKLRLFYEALPFSFIFSKLGGIGVNENHKNILDIALSIEITKTPLHRTTSLILTSKEQQEEIKTFIRAVQEEKT